MEKMILMVVAVSAIATIAHAWENIDLMQFQKDIKDSVDMIEFALPDEKGIQKKDNYKACVKSKGGLFSMAMADEWIKMKKFGSIESANGFSHGIAFSMIIGCYEEVHNSSK